MSQDFTFNDELLLEETDQDTAKNRFQEVFFALDHPELRREFQHWNDKADAAKSKRQLLGVSAVALAASALIIAALELLAHGSIADPWRKIIAGGAGLMGVAALWIALSQFSYGRQKNI